MCYFSDTFLPYNFLPLTSICPDRDPLTELRRILPLRINHKSRVGTDEDSKEGRFSSSVVGDFRKRGPGGRRKAGVHTDVCSLDLPQTADMLESRERGSRQGLLPCSLLGGQLSCKAGSAREGSRWILCSTLGSCLWGTLS